MSSTPFASATIPRLGHFPPRTPDAQVFCPECGATHTVTHADRVDNCGQPVSDAMALAVACAGAKLLARAAQPFVLPSRPVSKRAPVAVRNFATERAAKAYASRATKANPGTTYRVAGPHSDGGYSVARVAR